MRRVFGVQGPVGPWTTWIALLGAVGILLIAAAIVVDVFMRYVFNSPILGVDDLNKFTIAIVVASFFPLSLVGGYFVTIRFLGKALGTRAGLWLEVFGHSVTLFVFGLYGWQFLRFTIDVTKTGLATVVLEVPQAPWWWSVTIIMLICLPVQLIVLGRALVGAVTGVAPESLIPRGDQESGI